MYMCNFAEPEKEHLLMHKLEWADDIGRVMEYNKVARRYVANIATYSYITTLYVARCRIYVCIHVSHCTLFMYPSFRWKHMLMNKKQ